jgi:hypothetical protein
VLGNESKVLLIYLKRGLGREVLVSLVWSIPEKSEFAVSLRCVIKETLAVNIYRVYLIRQWRRVDFRTAVQLHDEKRQAWISRSLGLTL